jgi:hypothetical protein
LATTNQAAMAPLLAETGAVLPVVWHNSRQCWRWRLITFGSRLGHLGEFLSSDLDLEPGGIAFLYFRHRAEGKCFDTWTNDLSLAEASGASVASIENRVHQGIVNGLLVALLVRRRMAHQHGIEDEKALPKQGQCQTSASDGTDRPEWTVPGYSATPPRRTAKSCGAFEHCFHGPASQALYEAQVRPLSVAYP